jgi:hypothetical protein
MFDKYPLLYIIISLFGTFEALDEPQQKHIEMKKTISWNTNFNVSTIEDIDNDLFKPTTPPIQYYVKNITTCIKKN